MKNEHEVLIAGAGPTGLMLAGELKLAGIDVVVIERRATQDIDGSRAGGLHARTLEVFDQRGIAERFIAEGQVAQVAGFAWFPLDISDLPTRRNHGLALWQPHIERILAAWVAELGVTVRRGVAVTGFTQDDDGADVALDDGTTLRTRWLVGCDGGRSVVRKLAGIPFDGWDATVSHLIAEAELTAVPEWGLRRDARGIHALSPHEDGTRVRIMVSEPDTGRTSAPTLDDLRNALSDVYGSDFGAHSPTWISRFTDAARQAAQYRSGRVLLAGDAAHVHYPAGGQGLNTGVQDAVNLGWKLAQVVRGTSPETLLETYDAERHPVAAAVLRMTLAQVALLRTDDRTNALRDVFASIITCTAARHRLAGVMSGLDLRYDLGEGHALLGRRMPDLEVHAADGPTQVYSLLHGGSHVLLEFGDVGVLEISALPDRVRHVVARYDGAWELPVIGEVFAPAAVLVRPDGYVAWVGDGSDAGLRDALRTWVGGSAT